MSSPASDAFLKAWRMSRRTPYSLVFVSLTDPTARNFFLSSREVITPDGQLWQELLADGGQIVARSQFSGSAFEPCTASFEILTGRRLSFQQPGEVFLDIFNAYRWVGATISMSLYEPSAGDTALQVFTGIVQSYRINKDRITVMCTQRTDWNRDIPSEVVGTDKYPRSAEDSRGRVLPICYGKLLGWGLHAAPDGPWSVEYGTIAEGPNGLQIMAGGRRAVPGVVVDVGRGGELGGPSKIVFASHPCKVFGDDTKGTALWLEQSGKLCRMQPGAQVNNCRCASGVAQITRPSGSFLTDGVHPGSLVSNAIAASFNPNTRVVSIASATQLNVSNVANATVSVDTVGEFLDILNDDVDGCAMIVSDKPSGGTDPMTGAFVPIVPGNIEQISPLADNAENPRAILDPFDDTSYALLDWTTGHKELRARLTSMTIEGDLIGTQVNIEAGIHLVAGSISNVRIRLLADGGGQSADVAPNAPSPNPGYTGITISGVSWNTSGLPSTPWAFGECVARIYITASGTTVRVYSLGLAVQVRPRGKVVGQRWEPRPTLIQYKPRKKNFLGYNSDIRFRPYTRLQDTLVDYYGPIDSGWSANMQGWADTGGTYTGNGTDLIERGPDVVHHLLAVYGGQSAGNFNLAGSNAFGSFISARGPLKTWRQSDMVHALALTERTTIVDTIEAIAGDCISLCYLDRFTDKFHFVPWRVDLADTMPDAVYPRPIPKEWIESDGITVEHSPANEVAVAVRMPYSLDYVSKSPLREVSVGPDHSSAGWRYRKMRDQQMTVIPAGATTNRMLDFKRSSSTFSVEVSAGDYEPIALAQALASAMNVADTLQSYIVQYGCVVVAGYNDTIRFHDGTSAKTATIAAASYATFELLATAVAAAINAVTASPTNWSCSYSRATRKVTISRGSGTAQLLFSTGSTSTKTAESMLGFRGTDYTGGLSYTGEDQVEEQRFVISNNNGNTLQLLWETGANGLNSAGGPLNLATLLGFDTTRDSAVQQSHLGVSPKGAREWKLAAVKAKYGGKQEVVIPGTTVYDDDTARQATHTLVDMLSTPRVRIRFSSTYLPDLQRGRIITFEAGVDDIMPFPHYAGGGSWAGKQFVVTETRQALGPESFATDVIAMLLR